MPDERPADAMIIELASRGIKATKSDGYEIQVGGISVMVEPAGWTIAASYDGAPNLGAHVAAALDAITAITRSRNTTATAARISKLGAYIDESRPPHCHHTGYGGHQPWHGGHGYGFDGHDEADETECRLSPEEMEINKLRTEYAALQIDVDRRVAEAVAAEQAAVVSWIDKRLQPLWADIIERRANRNSRSLAWMGGEEKALMAIRTAVEEGTHLETGTPTLTTAALA